MGNVTEIKKDISFHEDFSTLVEILKSLAIVRYYELTKRIKNFDFFHSVIKDFLNFLDLDIISEHPFFSGKGKICIIAVTSEEGFLGGLNNRIISNSLDYLRGNSGKLIIIGLQGQLLAKGLDIPFEKFPGIKEEKRFDQALEMRDYIVRKVLSEKIGVVKVIYPYAHSLLLQTVGVTTLIPISEWFKQEKKINLEIIEESKTENMFEYLVFLFIGVKLWEIFGSSLLAEQGARYVHLEESSDRIKEEIKKLKLKYFRARHEIIDQQMRELFSAQSVFRK